MIENELDPLRNAILAGKRVVVVTSGQLEPQAREAATVAGRTSELRVLHFTLPPITAGSIRGDSRIVPSPTGELSGERVASFDGVPIETTEDAARAGILVCMVYGSPFKGGYLQEVLAHATGHWRAGRESAPVLFADIDAKELGARMPTGHPWTSLRAAPFLVAGGVYWVRAGSSASKRKGRDGSADWDRAVAECMASADARFAEGMASFSGSGRTAFARLTELGARRAWTSWHVQVFEIDPDGWHRGVALVWRGGKAPDVGALAASIWRGGIGMAATYATETGPPVDSQDIGNAAACLVGGKHGIIGNIAEKPGESQPDMALLVALPGRTTDQAVYRKVKEAPGDAPHRRDFAMTWPAFAHLLLDPGFRVAIDGGGRTMPLVAGRLGVSIAIARRIVGRAEMPALCARQVAGRPDLGAFLAAIGHDRLPSPGDRPGWEAFLACCLPLSDLLDRGDAWDAPPMACARILLGSGRDWIAREAAIGRLGEDAERHITLILGDAGDVVRSFAAWLSAIAGMAVPNSAAFELLARHGSIARLVEASTTWHADHHLSKGVPEIPDSATWPMPFGTLDLGDGWTVVPLTNPRQLRDEGGHGPDADGLDGLAHCVGGYARACWEGRSLILSVRRDKGDGPRRVTTAELRPKADGFFKLGESRYELTQHSGLRNEHAPKGAIEAMGRLMDMLLRDRVAIDAGALVQRSHEPPTVPVRERALALTRAWRRVLPRSLAAMEPDDMVALVLRDATRLAA
jgi:hypothetical protein